MPPISSTGVMIGSTAWKHEDQDDRAEDHRLRRQAELGDQRPGDQRPSDHEAQLDHGAPEATAGELDVAAPAVLVRKVGHRDHHQQRHQHAGQDAGEEQRADRDVGHHRVDHEGQ
jgi:hypothetical protein